MAELLFRRFEKIGRGSFGVVYRGYVQALMARQEIATGEPVAIKILDLDTDDEDMDDIQKEIAILSRCDSEYITRYRGAYLNGSKLWLILDYAGAGSLRSLLKSGTLSETVIAVICRQVLNALVYLHKHAGIIHRDIKAGKIACTHEKQIFFLQTTQM